MVNLHLALASAAALIALAFALCTLERWLDRRAPHEAAWTAALFLFSGASLALLAGEAFGWDGASFRAFYLLGAIVNVPYLALGTVWLLGGRRWGRPTTAAVNAFAAFAAGVIVVAPLRAPIPSATLPQGSDVFGALPRILAGVGSGIAATVVVGGALWSAARQLRARPTRRLGVANLLIASGTLVLGAGGVLNSVLDEMEGFAITLVVGITLLFAGFLLTSSRRRPALRAVDEAA